MPVNVGAYNELGVRPKSIADFDTERMGLQQHQIGLQQNALALQTSQQAMTDNNALRAAAQNFGTDTGANYNAILKTGNVKAAQDYQKSVLDAQKTNADIGLSQSHAKHFDATTEGALTENVVRKTEFLARGLSNVTSPEALRAWYQHGIDSGMTTPDAAQKEFQSVPLNDSAAFAQWVQAKQAEGVSAVDQLKQKQALQIANQVDARSRDNTAATNATHVQTTSMSNATTIKAAGISANTSRANNAANIQKDYTLAGMKPDGTPMEDGGGLLSPAAVTNAAVRYNIDSTLPANLGRGTQGPRQTAQILNEAANLAAARGETAEEQRIRQLANKSYAQALSKITTQEAVVGAAEKNFTANADMVRGLSQKVDRTGVPILNKWINAGKRSVLGDPDIAALDANIKATVNEYAKIVGGGTGSGATAQGEVTKIEGLLSAAQSPAQIESVLNVMAKEVGNRKQSFKDQKTEITDNMKRIAPKTSGAKPASGQTLRFDAQGNPVK